MNKLKEMDYAVVVNDKKMKGSGLTRGDFVMIIAMVNAPEKRSDPYLTRQYTNCIIVEEDGTHLLPNGDEGNESMVYMVDPRNLAPVSDEQTQEFLSKLSATYGEV